MAKLKPWYHVVTPREDLRDNRPLDASEFAVHLEHVQAGRAHDDYIKPARFFDRTFMTKSLLELSSQVVRRLSGIKVETSAVFNMATQFGGGKTHSLTALYHLANGGDAAKAWKGVDSILRKAQISTVPKADVAVFVGTEFDVLKGRGVTGEPTRKTPWGDIAWQLRGVEGFAAVAEHDDRSVAPGGDVIRDMLPDGPALILMDELLNYISRGRKSGMRDELFNFLQNLCEEARARDNLVVAVSIPASELEMNPEDQRDHESIKKLLDRLGKAIMMSAETESAEIIRRRLFEWGGLPEDGRKAATEYADWAVDHAAELAGVDAASARATFEACYPFHPSVLSVFERKWQSLPRFQRTRGILRLLALWVSWAYQKEHQRAGSKGDHLITLGSAPIEDPQFRAAMFEQLGSNELEGPVTTDIAGKSNAWSQRLDKEGSPEIKSYRLNQKVATSILFESNGGQTKHRASTPEIKMAVGSPDLLLPNVDTVLEDLVRSCYYLSQEGSYYKFSLSPNLNKILTDRRATVSPTAIKDRVRKEIMSAFQKPKNGNRKLDLEIRHFPEQTKSVPDRAELALVVLEPERGADESETRQWMEQIIRECGASGRTMKSAIIFVAAESDEVIKTAVRDLIAWEEIEDDTETVTRLDETQKRQLIQSLKRARSDMKESIWRSYRRVALLDKNNDLKVNDLGQITSSMANSFVELIINELRKDDEITDCVGPNKLVKYWPPALEHWSTRGVRNAFYSTPTLPRLEHGDSIRRTVADAVTQGLVGYAREKPGAGLELLKFGETLPEDQVEISDDMFIVPAETAQRLLEPPRLASLRIIPESVRVLVGEHATFEVRATDQYGHEFQAASIEWVATGGTIDESGAFNAGEEAGAFLVKARADGVEATTQVRVLTEKAPEPEPAPEPGGPKSLQWSGAVPPQKWMNFYTKVLSRFASKNGLRLRVSFEIPVDEAERGQREQETRAALRDLGLDEDVSAL
ncbi:MAG: ATP-binding protein [Phycisphaerales bacterium]